MWVFLILKFVFFLDSKLESKFSIRILGGKKAIGFSLYVFTEFTEFNDKNICHYGKRARTCHPATSCVRGVRGQDATTVPARHMWQTGSLNWAQFMLQWFIRFPEFSEFLFQLGKTPIPVEFRFDRVVLWLLTPRDLFPLVYSYPDQTVQTEGTYDYRCFCAHRKASFHSAFPVMH